MAPPKKRPLKKSGIATEAPNPFADALKQPFSRFLFNINLIEQRVRNEPSNGLVMNCVTGEYEFDPELCTARSEDELVTSVRRFASHQPKFGSAMLSSLAPDPEEKDETVLSKWRALNKQFDQQQCNKENQQQQRNIVKRKESVKQQKPFSKWALQDPSSSGSSSSTTSSTRSSLNREELNCSTTELSTSPVPLPSVVRPVYKKRKLWGLEFPTSSPPLPSSSLSKMPSSSSTSVPLPPASAATSSSNAKKTNKKLSRRCSSSTLSASTSSRSIGRKFSESSKK